MLHAVFLDRDGVINRERTDYVKSWDEVELLPGVLPALQALAALSIPICVLTNQSAIGRGIVSAATVDGIHERLRTLIAAHGGRIDAFFVCPHRPDEGCTCRKPKPGLLLQAAEQFDLDLGKCVFVGDSITDCEAAAAGGGPCIEVESGRQGTELRDLVRGMPEYPIVADLAAAAVEVIQSYANCPQNP
jgi:D-glycero-D-manno-heptose 1,7-bisphosphate phosphatase